MWIFTSLSFIFYMSFYYVASDECPNGCTCYYSSISCFNTLTLPVIKDVQNFIHLTLANVPFKHLPDDFFKMFPLLESLTIRNTNLRRLTSKMFQYAPSLIKIWLTSNEMNEIVADTFRGLPNLQLLDLSYNNLTSISTNFLAGSTKLTTLHLDFNQLTSVHENAFVNATSLEYLDLSHNMLTYIHENVFIIAASLWYIDLSHNLIESMHPRLFHGLKISEIRLNNNKLMTINNKSFTSFNGKLQVTLIKIWLYSNQINEIAADTFHGLPNLQLLDLSYNNLTSIPANFLTGSTKLTTLNLDFNQLTSVHENTFVNATSLRYIDLSHNLIESIPARLFHGLKISEIRLNNNKLTTLNNESFTSFTGKLRVTLTKIWLYSNEINEIATGTFQRLPNLQLLDLSYNNLTSIPANFLAGSTKLTTLNLDFNQLTSVHENTFVNGTSLRYIYLSHNLIESIPGRLFHGLDVSEIRLNNNRLTSINNESFTLFTGYVQSITLENNFIEFIEDYAFNDLNNGKIRELRLGGNLLQNITKNMFHGLRRIQYLSIQSNKISHIAPFSFSNMSSLYTLILSKNLLKEINEKAFYGLENLEKLYIDGNKIKELKSSLHPLTNLRDLLADNNSLTSISKENFMKNTFLYFLQLTQNSISFIEKNTFLTNYKLYSLVFSFNQLETLKKDTFLGLRDLRYLLLNNNKIKHIEKGTLVPLKTLAYGGVTFHNNKLSDIEVFNEIYHVGILNLAFNNFKVWPSFTPDALNLVQLNLSYNMISEISDTSSLFALEYLDISGNPINPNTLYQLSNLKTLDSLILANSSLTTFPLSSSSALQFIVLKNNNFTHLPDINLEKFPHLTWITISSNPLICDCHNYYITNSSDVLYWDGDCYTSVNRTSSSANKTGLYEIVPENLCFNNRTCGIVSSTCDCDEDFVGEFCEKSKITVIPVCNGTELCDVCVPINLNSSANLKPLGLETTAVSDLANSANFSNGLLMCHCYIDNATICVSNWTLPSQPVIDAIKTKSKISKYLYLLIVPATLLSVFLTVVTVLMMRKKRTKKDLKDSKAVKENIVFEEKTFEEVEEKKAPVLENETKESSLYESIDSASPVSKATEKAFEATKYDTPIPKETNYCKGTESAPQN